MYIKRLFRGSAARKRAKQEREDEMVYIGMKPAESTLAELQRELNIAYQKRKQEQVGMQTTNCWWFDYYRPPALSPKNWGIQN